MSEVKRYNKAWATGEYQPMNALANVQCLYRTFFFRGYDRLLDVGCGTGSVMAYHRVIGNIESYGIDFAAAAIPTWKKLGVDKWCQVASAENIPFKDRKFDMVTCMDMLEHVPEENVTSVLKEIYRVGSKDFLFTICLVPAMHKMPNDGSEPHICLKSAEWWVETMGEIGYRFHIYPTTNGNMLFCSARKNENKH